MFSRNFQYCLFSTLFANEFEAEFANENRKRLEAAQVNLVRDSSRKLHVVVSKLFSNIIRSVSFSFMKISYRSYFVVVDNV